VNPSELYTRAAAHYDRTRAAGTVAVAMARVRG